MVRGRRLIKRRMARVRYSLETGGWRQSSHETITKLNQMGNHNISFVERPDGTVVEIQDAASLSPERKVRRVTMEDGLKQIGKLNKLASMDATRRSIDEEREVMSTPGWSNAMRSHTFQENMLQSMCVPCVDDERWFQPVWFCGRTLNSQRRFVF